MEKQFTTNRNATSSFKEVLRRHEIQLTIEKYSPQLSFLPKEAVPKVEEVRVKGGNGRANAFAYGKGAPNALVALLPGFEHLNYQLGKLGAQKGLTLQTANGTFRMESMENGLLGEMALGACDGLSEHASPPVGYVQGSGGEFFLIFQLGGKALVQNGKSAGKALADYERGRFSSAVVERLAKLHSGGFACGGLKPEDVEMVGGKAKVMNASRLFAMDGSDSVFHEAASTLHFLKAAGFATSKELGKLAGEYMSYSPVCRAGVVSHVKEKKLPGRPHEELAKAAERFGLYFPQQQLKEAA